MVSREVNEAPGLWVLAIEYRQVLALTVVGYGPDIAEGIVAAGGDRPAGWGESYCFEECVASSHVRTVGAPYIAFARCEQWPRYTPG